MKPSNRIVLVLTDEGIDLLKNEISLLNKNSIMYQKLISWFLMAKCHKGTNDLFCLYWDISPSSSYISEEKFLEMFVHKATENEKGYCLYFNKVTKGTTMNNLISFVLEFDSAKDYNPAMLNDMLFT